jgi:4-carboxymuconolactone decarboxylase
MSEEDLRRGEEVVKRLFGDDYFRRTRVEAPETMRRDLLRLSDEVVYGLTYTRQGLGRADRSLCTIAALVVLDKPVQLRAHIHGALNLGVPMTAIREVVRQMAFYGGFPAALGAMAVADECSAEHSAWIGEGRSGQRSAAGGSSREPPRIYERDCELCQLAVQPLESSPPRDRVYARDGWRVVVHKTSLPGWLLAFPERHVKSLHELDDGEAARLGEVLRQSTSALVVALGATKSYVMLFAERTSHMHFSVVPRSEQLPPDRRGAAVVGYSRDEPIDDDLRDRVATQLAEAWRSSGS